MERIQVVRVHDPVSPGYVRFRVDRKSPLGNPYVIGTHGDREQVITAYSAWFLKSRMFWEQDRQDSMQHRAIAACEYYQRILNSLIAGNSIELACHCSPLPCHGGVIKAQLIRELDSR